MSVDLAVVLAQPVHNEDITVSTGGNQCPGSVLCVGLWSSACHLRLHLCYHAGLWLWATLLTATAAAAVQILFAVGESMSTAELRQTQTSLSPACALRAAVGTVASAQWAAYPPN